MYEHEMSGAQVQAHAHSQARHGDDGDESAFLMLEFGVFLVAFVAILFALYNAARPKHINPHATCPPGEDYVLEFPQRLLEMTQAGVVFVVILLFELAILSWRWVHVGRIFIDSFFVVDAVTLWVVWYASNHAEPLFRRLNTILNSVRVWEPAPQRHARQLLHFETLHRVAMPVFHPTWATFHHFVTFIGIHGFVSFYPDALLRVYMYGELPVFLIHASWFHKHGRPRPPNVDAATHLANSRTARALAHADRLADRCPAWIKDSWDRLRQATKDRQTEIMYRWTAIFYSLCRVFPFTHFAITQLPNFLWADHFVLCSMMLVCFGFVYMMNVSAAKKLLKAPFPELYEQLDRIETTVKSHILAAVGQVQVRIRQVRDTTDAHRHRQQHQ